MTEFQWFEAHPPRDLTPEQVTAVLRTLAGRPARGLRRLQPVVVFETWLRPDGVRWLVGIESTAATSLSGAFTAQLPGLVLQLVDEPERPVPLTARDLRLSSLSYPLRLDTAPAVTAGVLQTRDLLQEGEALVVQFVVGPSQTSSARPAEFTPLEYLGFKTPPKPAVGEQTAWKQKLAEPLFAVRGRVGARTAHPKRGGALLRPVVAALSLASGSHNRLRASQQSSRTAEQLTSVVGRTRSWSGIVNAAELATVLCWPLGEPPGIVNRFAPPPPSLLDAGRTTSKTVPERLLGRSVHPAASGALVRLPFTSYAAHCQVVGPSGVGKSTLLANWAERDAAAGRTVLVIEPKSDLVRDILERLPAHRLDDVVVIDPGAAGPVVGFTPLSGPWEDADRRADGLLQLFRDLFGSAIGPRSSDVLLHALVAVCRLDDGTLPDVPAFLTNPTFRRSVLAKVGDPLMLSPWAAWFDGLSEAEHGEVVAPVLNKLRVLTARPAIRRLLANPHPGFDLSTVFSGPPKVVLVNLNAGVLGQPAVELIGSLLLSQVWAAVQRQTTVPSDRRRSAAVIVDEWQDYVAGLDFADVLARARGAGVSFTLAHQHLDQLTPNLRAATLANARSRAVFRPAEGDARTLARVLGEPVKPEDLEQLAAFHAVARVLVDGAPSAAFEVATPPLWQPLRDAAELYRASAARYGVDPADLDAAVLERWRGQAPDTPVGARRRSS